MGKKGKGHTKGTSASPEATEHEEVEKEQHNDDATATAVKEDQSQEEEAAVPPSQEQEDTEQPAQESDATETKEDGAAEISTATQEERQAEAQEEGTATGTKEEAGQQQDGGEGTKVEDDAADVEQKNQGEEAPPKKSEEVGFQDLLKDLNEESSDLEAQIRTVEEDTQADDIRLQQEKVNTLEKADIVREHAKMVREEIVEMRTEIDNFPSDDSLNDMRAQIRQLSIKLMTLAEKRYVVVEEVGQVEKQSLVEQLLAQQTLEQHQQAHARLHALVNSKRYLYGTIEDKLSVPDTTDSIDILTEGREVSHVVAKSEWQRLTDEEAAEDVKRVKQQQDTRLQIFDIETRTNTLLDELTYAWAYEKEAILKQKQVLEAISKEHAYHLKRGSSHAKPTQRTAREKRLQEKQLELGQEVRGLVDQHNANREEIMELERLGNSLLSEMETKRKRFHESKTVLQADLKKHRKMHTDLKSEGQGWRELQADMEEMIREKRRRLAAASENGSVNGH